MFLGTVTATRGTNVSENTFDLLAVKKNGEINCYDGENLKDKWTSPASSIFPSDLSATGEFTVDFVQLTNAHSASQGILKGRQDVLAIFPEEISEDGFNPEIIVLITKSTEVRTLHILAMPRRSAGYQDSAKASIESLLTIDLPQEAFSAEKTTFSLQVSTGLLQQLSGNSLYTFDLTDTLPKRTSILTTAGAQSFLRLSSTSIMISDDSSITVFNPKYQSILATVDIEEFTDSPKRKRENEDSKHSCEFVTYFPKLGSAIAVSGHNLIAIQVEGQVDRQGRPRATGLLIDSLGCSIKGNSRLIRPKKGKTAVDLELKTMDLSTFGSVGNVETPFSEQSKPLNTAASKDSVDLFDTLLSDKMGVDLLASRTAVKSDIQTSNIDRRWIIYALSKIFKSVGEDESAKLSIAFYPPQTFTWLLSNGHMTVSNVQMAVKSNNSSAVLRPGQLVDALVEFDLDMDLLLLLVSENYLDAAELLHAIRRLMESLGLLQQHVVQSLLTNGEDTNADDDAEEQIKRLEAEAESDLAMAEYQLGSGSGVRGQALSTGLSKLYTCPDAAIIYAIQTSFSANETISLIYLLRYELGRGAWTSRYIDNDEANIIDEEAEIPNHAITLIASLLNNCIDAIGAGGWLTGESRLVSGDPFEAEELIASLKLEVGAALEGIEEAKYMSGLISEMVRYGDAVLKANAGHDAKRQKGGPKVVVFAEQDKMLPFGLKAEGHISLQKIGAGGEVQRRSKREIELLQRKKVGKYTLERIEV